MTKFWTEGRDFIGVVVDKRVKDGTIQLKIRVPSLHGPDVNNDHLPWINMEVSLGQFGASMSPGAPDFGQLVRLAKDIGHGGTGFGRILSVLPYIVSADSSVKGAKVSVGDALYKAVDDLRKLENAIQLPPDLVEKVNAQGAKVVEAVEKGLYKLEDLVNLASTGAQVAGVMIPQLKNMTTAFTPFAGIINGSILSMLPGVNFNIGNLMNLLPDALKEELFKTMPPEVQAALNSYLKMTQNYTVGNFGGAISGMRVNLEVFLPNLVNELKNVTNIDDMFGAIQNVMSNTQLFGLDALGALNLPIPSAFGNLNLNINVDGSIGIDTSALTSSLGNLTGQLTSLSGTLSSLTSGLTSQLGSLTSIASGLTGALGGSGSTALLDNIPNFGQKVMSMNTDVAKKLQQTLGKINASGSFSGLIGSLGV